MWPNPFPALFHSRQSVASFTSLCFRRPLSPADKSVQGTTYHVIPEVNQIYEACPERKDTSRVDRYGIFYAYYGNSAADLDHLPVSRARLTVVEPALFE